MHHWSDDQHEREELEIDLPREIPGVVACALCFVDDDLRGEERRRARKQAVRRALVPLPADWNRPGIMITYDDSGEVWAMIREVLAES